MLEEFDFESAGRHFPSNELSENLETHQQAVAAATATIKKDLMAFLSG